jgi:hypothetical protein
VGGELGNVFRKLVDFDKDSTQESTKANDSKKA